MRLQHDVRLKITVDFALGSGRTVRECLEDPAFLSAVLEEGLRVTGCECRVFAVPQNRTWWMESSGLGEVPNGGGLAELGGK